MVDRSVSVPGSRWVGKARTVTQPKKARRSLLVDMEPRSVTLCDATASAFRIRPKEPPQPGDKGVAIGCLYDAAAKRVDLSQRQGMRSATERLCVDPPTVDPADPQLAAAERRDGRTLYLGHFTNHYGHFITEFLSRLWLPEQAGGFDHIVAYPSIWNRGRYLPTHAHRYLAGLLGLPLERLEMLRAPARFAEIVVPQQLWEVNGVVNVRVRPLYVAIHIRHADTRGATRGTGRIFLSRGLYPGNRLSNSPEVEAVFASFGFTVHHPQELAIERQLDLYANCEILAGLSGSGMHNCLFCRPGTPVIEVGDTRSPRRPTTMQLMANELAMVKASFIPYAGDEDGRTNVAALTRRLQHLLGERPRGSRLVGFHLRRAAEWVTKPRQVLRRNRKR
jgi:Glycosyltransferase 61